MRVRVTTQMDQSLQLLFRAAESTHHKTIADALDIGVREVLKDIDPESILTEEIEKRAAELEEQRQILARMQQLSPEQKRPGKNEKSAGELERMRCERFEKEKNILRKELRRGDVNRNRLLWDYQFLSWKDAVAWFRAHLDPTQGK